MQERDPKKESKRILLFAGLVGVMGFASIVIFVYVMQAALQVP